jgi:hypothetical protein
MLECYAAAAAVSWNCSHLQVLCVKMEEAAALRSYLPPYAADEAAAVEDDLPLTIPSSQLA